MDSKSSSASSSHIIPAIYTYPGGTLHLAPLAAYSAGLILVWLNYAYGGGLQSFATPRGWFWIGFASLWLLAGVSMEWSWRNQVGRISVNADGLNCTLPWGRRRHLRWGDIREVRCVTRRFEPSVSFWEIRGASLRDRITFSWELKGYQEILRTIHHCAPNLQRFDAEPEDLASDFR